MKGSEVLLPFLELLPTDQEEIKFTLLYEKYFMPLQAYAKSIVKSNGLAEDVVQEAFKRLLKNLHKVGDPDCRKTKAYLVKIVRNIAIDVYNKHVKISTLNIDDFGETISEGDSDPTWDICDANALASDLKNWIARLSDREQLLLRYKIFENWSYQEIEDSFGIKEPTASSIVSRAKKKLMKQYKKERGDSNE